MKIKNLVVGTLLVGSLFTTVGCQSTQNNEDVFAIRFYDSLDNLEMEDLELVKYVIDNNDTIGRDVVYQVERYLDSKYTDDELGEYEHNCGGIGKDLENLVDYSDNDRMSYQYNNGIEDYNKKLNNLEVEAIDATTFYERIASDEYDKTQIEAPTPETDYNNVHCDNCGEVIPSDHIDSCGGYWCENCDYVK